MDKLGYNVTVEISNVTTQGPPATGKTSVIDLAMGRPPAVERHSTGVAEPPSCSIIVGDDSSENVEWEELTPDRMLDMVCVKVSTLFLKLCLLFSPNIFTMKLFLIITDMIQQYNHCSLATIYH